MSDAGNSPPRFRALVGSLRRASLQPALPVYAAQLAPYGYEGGRDLLAFWAAQQELARALGSGLVTTADLGDLNDVHPLRKAQMGERFAALALNRSYGRRNLPATGPELKSVRFLPGGATLRFRCRGDLRTLDSASARGFALAGADGAYRPALAMPSGSGLRLTCQEVPQPLFMRHCWQVGAEPNLSDDSGIPAIPFTTQHSTAGR